MDVIVFKMVSVKDKYVLNEQNLRKILYSPLKDQGFVPERGSEIFVSSVPEKATVHQLAQFFEQIGDIFQVKLTMQPDGVRNRGFAFVTFMKSALAQKAIIKLKNTPFLGKKCLSLQMSCNNCRIFLGGIPTSKTKDEIWQQLLKVYKASNILDILTYRNPQNLTLNRGFVFLEFQTHEEAAHFRAKHFGKLVLFGKPVLVDWAVPVLDAEEDEKSQVKIIFIRNMDINLSAEDFAQEIYSLIGRNAVEKVYKRMHYAYVHLSSRQNAEKLMTILKRIYEYSPVEVTWANPPNKFTDRRYRTQTLNNRRLQSMRNNIDTQNFLHPSSAEPYQPPAIASTSRHVTENSFYPSPSSGLMDSHPPSAEPYQPPAIASTSRHVPENSFYSNPSSGYMDWTDEFSGNMRTKFDNQTNTHNMDVPKSQNPFELFKVPILPQNLTPFDEIQPSYPPLTEAGSIIFPDSPISCTVNGPSTSTGFSPVISRPAPSDADDVILLQQLEDRTGAILKKMANLRNKTSENQ